MAPSTESNPAQEFADPTPSSVADPPLSSSSTSITTSSSSVATSSTPTSAPSTPTPFNNVNTLNVIPPTTSSSSASSSPTNSNGPVATVITYSNGTIGNSTSHEKSSGVSGGAAAGIGIGGVIIGALIGLLFTFLFMKRSRKHRSTGGHRDSSSFDNEKNIGGAALASGTLDETLLDRADDSQLRKSMQDLSELIDQHVENNYHLQAFEGNQGSLERRLVESGYTTQPSASEVAALLLNPRTRFAAIREVIAKILVGNLECKSHPDLTLLPPHIVGFVKSIPPVERLSGADTVFDKAFTKWRHLSAFLLESSRSAREAPKANERELQPAIARNVALINSILKPFINPAPESQRSQENNLSAIIFEGAQLGLLLFSQPSVWVFRWNAPANEGVNGSRGGRPFVIFPALTEKIERQGRQRLREVSTSVITEL